MTSDPELERRAMALIEQAIDVAEAERQSWLERQTADHPDLRRRVLSLHAASIRAGLRTGGAAADLPEEETDPERVGPYRIVRRIGRGGMGSVYLAERTDADFRHAVAIKVIKPGLLSEALVERFRHERRTLAGLSHPNIARLYDGGETEAGSPYIVMEYVDGEPLLHWADRVQPDLRERRRLFGEICAAVAFAHRNLIVHRDLTPSNVLVTAEGQAKLIDFGIAKPADLAEEGDDAPASLQSLSLTPGYAAPERMTSTRVTTAADVYSLGRLLEGLMPPRPGDRELRAIIDRATAAVPAERYPSVDALMADMRALDAGLPVAAVGGGRRYLAGKFIARHRRGVAAAAAVLLCLLGALVLTTRAYNRADAARSAEARRFAELRSLANYLLFELEPRLGRVIGNTAARADLAARAQRYLSQLAASPGTDPALKVETALGLIRLARVQGVPSEPNLGGLAQARANLTTAERLLGTVDTPRARAARAEAQALAAVVLLHGDLRKEAAATTIGTAERTLATVPPDTPGRAEARRALRKAELEQADLSDRAGELPRLADALVADIARWPATTRASRAAAIDRAQADYYRALALYIAGDAKAAVPRFLAARRGFDALIAAVPNDPVALYLGALNASIGFAAASQLGREDISQALIADARASIDRLLRLEPNDAALYALAANIKEGQSQNLRDIDRFDEAIALQQAVVADRGAAFARRPLARNAGNIAFSQAILGVIARDGGDRTLACASWRAALAGFLALERRGQLLGFHAGFIPGLGRNVAKCDAGAGLKALGPLR